uniref:BTB/POZ domain-containing protein n=1 Tax=Ananas comosus var. bracteatus TaxID=296719 RepID=A0A6V7PYR3_ANACO|nr:unnamed protein product [Ananas comosus var. bracteatus]
MHRHDASFALITAGLTRHNARPRRPRLSPLLALLLRRRRRPFLDRDPRIFSLLLSFLRLRAPPPPPPPPTSTTSSPRPASSPSPRPPLLLSSSSSSTFLSPPPSPPPSPSPPRPPPPLRRLRHLRRPRRRPRRRRLLLRPLPPPPPPPRRPRPFPAVDSLLALSPSLAAAGATDFPGLHLLPLLPHHSPPPPSPRPPLAPNPSTNSTVLAVAASPDALFVSFESSRRNASAVLAYDLNSFDPVLEVGRKEIFGAELDSAIPATKLRWVAEFGLLMAAGSHAGPSGLSGNIALWDIRSNKAAWEITEKSIDCFADVAVSDGLRAMFKVGVNSGEVFMADLRKLGAEEPWVCLGDGRKGRRSRVLDEVVFGGRREGFLEEERVMRKNWMGRAKDRGGKKITHLAFGGSRMVLARKDEQSVEVWCTEFIYAPSAGKF